MDNSVSICFVTMCKNEEHCIKNTLESVYKHIDYWIVCDTGSNDKTCEIVTEFFKEKNIPGELFVDEWKGFDKNKSLMFERAFKKTDYVLHLDADDILYGNFDKKLLINNKHDAYNFRYIRSNNNEFLTSSLYNNQLKWIYVGVAHNLIICLDKKQISKSNLFVTDSIFVDNMERGSRKNNPNKYIIDAKKLKQQFFDTLYNDPYDLNYRSVFYTAQSYFDAKYYKEAIQWYTLFTKFKNTWIEELYISYIKITQCQILLKFDNNDIIISAQNAINTIPDRAEAYYLIGKYLNDNSLCEKAYSYFKKAMTCDYNLVCKKYILFINKLTYGKYINDELAVSCYWTNRCDEGYKLLKNIIEDQDFIIHKERLITNKLHFEKKYNLLN